MNKYTLVNNQTNEIVKDENGDDVSFIASKDELIVDWIRQKEFILNDYDKTSNFKLHIEYNVSQS